MEFDGIELILGIALGIGFMLWRKNAKARIDRTVEQALDYDRRHNGWKG